MGGICGQTTTSREWSARRFCFRFRVNRAANQSRLLSLSRHRAYMYILGCQKKFASDFGPNFLSQFSSNLCRPIHRRKAHVIARVQTNPFFRFSASETKYWKKEFSLMNVASRPRQKQKRLHKIDCQIKNCQKVENVALLDRSFRTRIQK